MSEQTMKAIIGAIIGLIGLLVTLLQTDFDNFGKMSTIFLQLMFALATFFLIIAAVTGLASYLKEENDDPEKLVKSSCLWLLIGIICIFPIILAIVLKSVMCAIVLWVAFCVFLKYEAKLNRKSG